MVALLGELVESLEGKALLEEVLHWGGGWALSVYRLSPFPLCTLCFVVLAIKDSNYLMLLPHLQLAAAG